MMNIGKFFQVLDAFRRFSGQVFSVLLKLALMFGLLISLAACGTDDVVLEGKLFEAAGIAGGLTQKKKTPKVKARSGLILPPAAHLPEPGKRAVAQDDQNWPDDPDVRRKRLAAQTEAGRKKYCTEVGRNRSDPDYDEEKASQCGSLFSKALTGFTRADKEDN